MYMLAAQVLVGSCTPGLQSLARRPRRNQRVAAAADQVLPPRLFQGLPHIKVILRLEELKQGALQLAVAQVARDVDFLLGKRIETRVIHAGGDVERSGDEILNLIRSVAVALEKYSQVNHG